ncbi:MAG: prepilin-type N-terminal cleavage/methylation domain-containing protein [Desulfobacterales bacterium]|nr:MAG: prepilin-type N-terminal cleavage/methylation domain-containing protein [Desulfobacterales bacterium]
MYPTPDTFLENNQKGFSLIEMLIALAILALAMLAAASMQFNSIRNNTSGNIVTQANMLAKSKMEELKNTADLTTLTNGADNGIDAAGQPGGIYDRTWTIENMGTTARRITVTVQWNKGSQTRRISISTNTRGNGV